MTQQASAPDVVDLFKKCYGDTKDLLPSDFPLQRDIKWDEGEQVGEEFIIAVILGNEVGITLGGSGTEAFEIDPARAGAVKQAKVRPYVTVLPSVIPWSVLSRSAGGGKKAFFAATKHVTKNNLRSHGKFHEIFRFYGQATARLGYVSYATATYRTISFTNGGGALGGITFTAGVNTTSKHILLAPGNFAAGHWVGMKGVAVQQVATSSGVVVAEGSLTSIDTKNGILGVDFTPVAATSTTSHHVCIKGQAENNEMIGIQKILSTTSGTVFDINVATYELFRGNAASITGKLTLAKINLAVADAVNAGEIEGDITLYVNPRTWATMTSDEAALREHDASYDESNATNGFKDITYYVQSGKITIKAHTCVKEGDAFGLVLSTWSRSGSAEISFKVPGVAEDMIFPLQNQAGMAFRSYSDQFVFCHRPSWNIYFYGINDESTT